MRQDWNKPNLLNDFGGRQMMVLTIFQLVKYLDQDDNSNFQTWVSEVGQVHLTIFPNQCSKASCVVDAANNELWDRLIIPNNSVFRSIGKTI